jgi:hypothetical protein
MEVKQCLELVEVNKNDAKTTLELLFLDKEETQIYTVKFSRQKYNKDIQEFVDSDEKSKNVDDQLQTELGVCYDTAENAVGKTHDIYVYSNRNPPFNSLTEASVAKPDEEFLKKYRSGFYTTIDAVEDTGERIRLIFTINGDKYATSNSTEEKTSFNYGDWLKSREQFLPNALKKEKAYSNFTKIFGIPIEDKDSLIGRKIKIYPNKAGKNYYIEFEIVDDNLPF